MTVLSRFLSRSMRLPPAQTTDVSVQRDLRVPMHDGVTLLADRYAPAGADGLPLILVRCPYGRRGLWGTIGGRLLAERGFQSVVQSCRGTFGSGGRLDPFGLAEQDDGLATVEWLREQPWYPGSFGTWGPSYLGITQWALASLALPDHRAMAVQVSASRPRELVTAGGAFALETMLEWVDQVARQERPGAMFTQALRARALRTVASQLPLGDLDRLATGRTIEYWQDWLASDDGFWERHQFGTGPQRTSAAIAMIGGWHDIFLPAQLRDYAALRQAGHEPTLMIGPWRHADTEAAATWIRSGLEFFRTELGGQSADGQPDQVRTFVTGAEEWRWLPAWPPPATAQTWYLQSHATLAMTRPPNDSRPDTYVYDPADPTPNVAGPVGNQGRARVDNRILEARPDVLTFTTSNLDAYVEVIGVPAVDLHAGSDHQHTDFFARLCEVNPAGQSLNISDGLLRLSPGQPEAAADGTRRVRFELWPVAHRFRAGSRLRLQISSGAHPRYARNTGAGEPLATATTLVTARQVVYHDPAHPSAVILPVVSS